MGSISILNAIDEDADLEDGSNGELPSPPRWETVSCAGVLAAMVTGSSHSKWQPELKNGLQP
jgi:hypothetical protein